LLGIACVLALWRIWKHSRADAIFFALVIFSAPMAGIIAGRYGVLFPRYFIFSAAWSLVLAGLCAGAAWDDGRRTRIAIVVLLTAFIVGHAIHINVLLRHGRGEYQAALRYIAEHTTTSEIKISSDHDNRNLMLIQYYASRNAPGRRVIYLTGNRTTPDNPEWLLVHRLDGLPAPDSRLYDDRGNVFALEKKFPHAPLSGWDWFVFRNVRPL
jgi:hypothetical protein